MSNKLNQLKRDADLKRRNRGLAKRPREQLDLNRATDISSPSKKPYSFQHNSTEPKSDGVIYDKSFFLLRIMIAACLFLLIAISFKGNVTQLEGTKKIVAHAYEQEFQFAMIANWYEEQFGRPLALLPVKDEQPDPEQQPINEMDYAIPASGGTITERFSENGHGILVETGALEEVKAVKGGFVESIGEDETIGKRVVVQHYDQTKTIYGMLNAIDVNIYDHIQAGHTIGTVSKTEGEEKGQFYFAIQKGDSYIDPSDVISFE
ncbi:peptidoglycan DD-metalloendopeptidase family protein [Alkalihalobacillus sp. 1P02AB]|uniref:peptidoglycan DD-metalloendopeptidase family protein n=1 Tax=Alkalihalobacillus sp. 1P02AB TaxID=3132260 RepID=UPI0039A629BC